MLSTTSPLLMNEADRAAFGRLEDKVKLSRYGGDCYAYCMLAAGLIDLVIETEIKPYDIVALIPIIAGAGGIVTTWENGPAQAGGRIVVAGDKRVHQAALEMLEGLVPRAASPVHTSPAPRAFDLDPRIRSFFFYLSASYRRAGHEGVERRPELPAIVILLLQDLVLGAGKNEMPAGQQILPESLDRRRRDNLVAAGRDHQDRLADAGRHSRAVGERFHLAQRGIGPGDRRRAETELRAPAPAPPRCAHSAPDRR